MEGNCLFCKIVNGEIPSKKIYEDDDFVAFLDIAPIAKGHALVIPKKHFERFDDMLDELFSGYGKAIKKVSSAVVKSLNADGYNIIVNNGSAAGQVVFHCHAHVIPRFANDGLKMQWPHGKYDGSDMDIYAKKISKHL